MTTIDFNALRVSATEHEPLPGEIDQNIQRVVEIRYRSMTLVVLEGGKGELFGGMYVNRQNDVAFVKARQNAWNHMRHRRERQAENRSRYEEA